MPLAKVFSRYFQKLSPLKLLPRLPPLWYIFHENACVKNYLNILKYTNK